MAHKHVSLTGKVMRRLIGSFMRAETKASRNFVSTDFLKSPEQTVFLNNVSATWLLFEQFRTWFKFKKKTLRIMFVFALNKFC